MLFIFAYSYLRVFDNYELGTLDLRFRLRPPIKATDKIVIIEIGEDTIDKIGRFPFERSYHAAIIKALSEAGAKAIVFDIFFSEPQKDDPDLEEAMSRAGNVYLPYVFYIGENKKYRLPKAAGYLAGELRELSALAKGSGHINIIPDPDGKYRRVPLYISYENKLYPYLPFKIACDYLNIEEKDIIVSPGKSVFTPQGIKILVDAKSNMIVNFAGRWGKSYKHYSYIDILQSYFAGLSGVKAEPDLKLFKDKICVIGLTAVGTADLHPNPIEPLYPAVGIYAEVFNSILNNSFITRASEKINMFILLILCLLVVVFTLKTKPIKGIIILSVLIIVFIMSAILTFNMMGLWIDIAYPVFITVIVYIFTTLYKYVNEWKKRLVMENELGIARKIQESFLPKNLPSVAGVDIYARMFTARQVGGDLYDFTQFSDNSKLGVMIGDVSGKGVPASLFMAMVTGAFRSFAVPDARPEEVLLRLNSKLVKESASNLFVTVFYSIFDLKNNTLEYANGGHLPVLYLQKDGAHSFLDVEKGAPLGLMDNEYSGRQAAFGKGDVFIFYTDGVTEAMNSRRQMYEKTRLLETAKRNRYKKSREILEAIEKDIRKFEPKSTQHDDITLIVAKIL